MRYAALACVIAGGLLMSGPSVVALADETGADDDGSGTTVEAGESEPTAAPASEPRKPPRWPVLRWLSTLSQPNTQRVGPVAPPQMNLPTAPTPAEVSATVPGNGTDVVQAFVLPAPTATNSNPQVVTVTVPESAQGHEQRSPNAAAPDNTQTVEGGTGESQVQSPAQQAQQINEPSPPSSLQPVDPSDVPVGPGTRIENPLPGLEKLGLDPTKSVIKQLLPTPLVMLITVAEHIPLVNLVVIPLMQAADAVATALLSGAVIPSDGSVVTPGKVSTAWTSYTGNELSLLSLPGSGLPADLALTGMDMPLAPAKPAPPAPPAPPSPPQPPNVPPNNVVALGEKVEFRAGYSDYLRNAGMAQITAIAVPGAVAILLFSIGGGFIGYRQARAGHVIRAEGIARFLR